MNTFADTPLAASASSTMTDPFQPPPAATDAAPPLPTGDVRRPAPAAAGGAAAPELLERVVQGAHATIDRLAESAAPHVQRLGDSLGLAEQKLEAGATQAREVGDEWAEALRSIVREHPIAALATAAALGVLVARMTSHR